VHDTRPARVAWSAAGPWPARDYKRPRRSSPNMDFALVRVMYVRVQHGLDSLVRDIVRVFLPVLTARYTAVTAATAGVR
jgi:hypothetical protein